MSTDIGKQATGSEGKKLWIFWVFGLGFFAGFLVSLFLSEKMKNPEKKEVATIESQPKELERIPSEPIKVPDTTPEDRAIPASKANLEQENEVVMTKAMRDRLLTFDILRVLQDAEIRRYKFEGETKGIIITKIRTGSIFERLGFKDGDVIEHINGIALADIEKRKGEFSEKLPGVDKIEFRVRRDEKVKTLRVKVADEPE